MEKDTSKMRTVGKLCLIPVSGLLILAIGAAVLFGIAMGILWIQDRRLEHIAKTVIDVEAETYIQENYPDNDFVIEDAFYVFKDNCYRVKIQSPSSQDTHFHLDYDYKSLELVTDSYQTDVIEGWNTFRRISEEYGIWIHGLLEEMPELGSVEVGLRKASKSDSDASAGLAVDKLVPDGVYDVAEIGTAYGFVKANFLVSGENVHIQHAMELLLEMDSFLQGRYEVMEITLQDKPYPDTSVEFYIYDVTREDLFCDEPLTALQAKWEEQEAKREALRKKWQSEDG